MVFNFQPPSGQFESIIFPSVTPSYQLLFLLQGEPTESYSPQSGLFSLGSFDNQPGYGQGQLGGRGIYELVSKRDWKGQLQTSLLRKYRGAVDIKYAFSQSVRTDDFESIVILTHTDPSIGSCIITGNLESTKKASEKTAAQKACQMLDADNLRFIPYSGESLIKNRVGIDEYPQDEPAQELGTALKGLFGNNYTLPSAVATVPSTPSPHVSYNVDKSRDWDFDDPNLNAGSFNSSYAKEPQNKLGYGGDVVRLMSLRVESIDPARDPSKKVDSSDKERDREREQDDYWMTPPYNNLDETLDLPISKLTSLVAVDCFHDDITASNKVIDASVQPTNLDAQPGLFGETSPSWCMPLSEFPWVSSKPTPHATPLSSLLSASVDSASAQKPDNPARSLPLFSDDSGVSHADMGVGMGTGLQQQSRGMQSDIRAGRGPPGLQKPPGMSFYANGQYDFNSSRTPLSPIDARSVSSSFPSPSSVSDRTITSTSTRGIAYDSLHSNNNMNLSLNTSLEGGADRRVGQGRGAIHVGSSSAALNDDVMRMLNNARTENILLTPSSNKTTDIFQDVFSYDQSTARLGGDNGFTVSPMSNLTHPTVDFNSDSKYRVHSFADEMSALQSEKKATDWKGELQTFLARNCKDYPFKIEYNSEDRVAGGKFVARVTITFDNKEEEMRVVHGIPAINKKTTERTAAGTAILCTYNDIKLALFCSLNCPQ